MPCLSRAYQWRRNFGFVAATSCPCLLLFVSLRVVLILSILGYDWRIVHLSEKRWCYVGIWWSVISKGRWCWWVYFHFPSKRFPMLCEPYCKHGWCLAALVVSALNSSLFIVCLVAVVRFGSLGLGSSLLTFWSLAVSSVVILSSLAFLLLW